MPITITGDNISFESSSGTTTTFLQEEIINLQKGKSISGSGELVTDRIMGSGTPGTYIDLGGGRRRAGKAAGTLGFVSAGRDVFSLESGTFQYGQPDTAVTVNIQGDGTNSAFLLTGSFEATGSSFEVQTPELLISNGFMGAIGLGNIVTITEDCTIPAGYVTSLQYGYYSTGITIQLGTEFTIEVGGEATIVQSIT